MKRAPHWNGFIVVLLLIGILISSGCRPGVERAPDGPPLKLSLAVSPALYSGLIAVADEKGYFREAGLEVSLVPYPSGREALEVMCKGEVQVATMACIAFAAMAPKEPSIRIIASIGSTVGSQIVARRDRNIQTPSDLKGKRVGISPGTISDYYLYTFLMAENIPLKDVTTVDIPADRQSEALVNGEVDAVSAFDIYSFEAKKRLGDIAVSWDTQNNIAYHWVLVAEESTIRSPEPLKRLLKALLRAERFVRANEEETKRIIARKWGFDPEFIKDSWPRTRLDVSFDQAVVTSQIHYALWQMRKAGRSGDPPDVLDYLHPGILEEVAPGSVTIFR